jgi:hypothetical protein
MTFLSMSRLYHGFGERLICSVEPAPSTHFSGNRVNQACGFWITRQGLASEHPQ